MFDFARLCIGGVFDLEAGSATPLVLPSLFYYDPVL